MLSSSNPDLSDRCPPALAFQHGPQGSCYIPEPDSRFFGIPRYQPFIGARSFNYEHKYPPDPLGQEARDEARVWSTYLDEAESYDHDMIQGFRDTLDSLLVLAGLFSAIVATFVSQTSQSLRPDFVQLTLLVQLEQVALLRSMGNVSAMSTVPASGVTTVTSTYTRADLWINGLFFTSLSLSIATALLAVLVKQWCQAYTSVTPGSARDKCLTRQFRFDGLTKWKLPEIVGSLPLLLHLAFVVFFAGLSYFVYDLHRTLSSIVIISSILSIAAYFSAIVLPAIWLECPYRIPILFRPARLAVYLYISLREKMRIPKFYSLSQYLPPGEWKKTDVLTSLRHAEEVLLSIPHNTSGQTLSPSKSILARSFSWLFALSKNQSTRRIVAAALYGCLVDEWDDYQNVFSNFPRFMDMIPSSSIAECALQNFVAICDHNQLRVLIALLDVLFDRHRHFQNSAFHTVAALRPVSGKSLDIALLEYMRHPTTDPSVRDSLVRWGADVNFQQPHSLYPSPLSTAIQTKNLDNVRWLISSGANVNLLEDGWTPLMEACYHGHIGIARYLVEYGADVNVVGEHFEAFTALSLILVSSNPDFEFIGHLLAQGARLNTRLNAPDDTPFHRAVTAGKVEVVRFLLERGYHLGSTLEQTYKIYWSPLVSHDHRQEIMKLLEMHSMVDSRTGTFLRSQCLPYTVLSPVLSKKNLA
ncbi:hypothetical protein DL96DRAFT_1638080 [Flagelloscypha sp. PMI_526]|nr:hypothetical protein DL96DRAFT_1638080 [Flagelloscypha sp. PMI_526]